MKFTACSFNTLVCRYALSFILRVKLKHLDEWNARRASIARNYLHALSEAKEIELPRVADGAESVWHLFVVSSLRRDDLQNFLNASEIGTMIHYPVPPHLSEAYADQIFRRESYPITEELAATVLSLPISPQLKDEEQDKVINSLLDFEQRAK